MSVVDNEIVCVCVCECLSACICQHLFSHYAQQGGQKATGSVPHWLDYIKMAIFVNPCKGYGVKHKQKSKYA